MPGITHLVGGLSVRSNSARSPGAASASLVTRAPLSLTTRSRIAATLLCFGIRTTFKVCALPATPAPSKPKKTSKSTSEKTAGRLSERISRACQRCHQCRILVRAHGTEGVRVGPKGHLYGATPAEIHRRNVERPRDNRRKLNTYGTGGGA